MDNKIFKFSKKELERLGCNEKETDLVMKYQRKLPILVNENETIKYCINAKELYNQLGVKHSLSRWIKNNLLCNFIQDEDFEICFTNAENKPLAFKDYCEYSMQKLNYYKITKSFMITMNCAKEIAMIAGIASNANEELKNNSKLARTYFILMEGKIKENKEWLDIRDPEKLEYKRMSTEIEQWVFRIWHRKASKSEYSVEANMINKIVTGRTSQELKLEYGVSSWDLIRDYLKKKYNEELLFLERQNQVLLRMDMGFTERMNMLTKMYEVTFKDKKMQAVA